MRGALRNARFALRSLAKKPGFTLAVLLLLVLGIGSNTAIFTLLRATFSPQAGLEEPRGLVSLYGSAEEPDGGYSNLFRISYPVYEDVRDRSEVFSDVAAYQRLPVNLTRGTEAVRATAALVTGNYFRLLGVRPLRGRFFDPGEGDVGGGAASVVLSYGAWRRVFGGDPGIVGDTVLVNGYPLTVAGVAPRSFRGSEANVSVDAWAPLSVYEQVSPYARFLHQRQVGMFDTICRLGPAGTLAQARQEMAALAGQLGREYPAILDGVGIRLLPFGAGTILPQERDRYVGYGRTLVAAVALILLIAVVNVANLLVVRGRERSREMGIRQAVGATRGRLLGQLLTENLLLFLLGGALSLPVARLSLELLWRFRPPEMAAETLDLSLDLPVLAFTLAVSLVTGLVFGLLPAIRASRPDLVATLKDSPPPAAPRYRRWQARNLLVLGQVALALVALIGAGLFLTSLRNARQVDLGFDADHLLAITLTAGDQGYDEARVRQFYREVQRRVEALPGVEAAALAENRLLRGARTQKLVYLEGQEDAAQAAGRSAHRVNIVSRGYFRTAGIPLLQGRGFNVDDGCHDCPRVAVINRTMAELAWPGEDPVGKRFRFNSPTGDPVTVVGVARDAKYRHLYEAPQFFIYVPLIQEYAPTVTLHVRTAGPPAAVLDSVRAEVRAIEPNLPLVEADTLSHFVAGALWMERTAASLLAVFGGLALVLAAVGLYGVMAYTVGRRRREISLRMALGARRSQVLGLVVGEAAVIVGLGVVVGWALAWLVLAPLVASQLHEVSATSPAIYAAQALVLAAVGLLGCYLPARRAVHTNPAASLRVA